MDSNICLQRALACLGNELPKIEAGIEHIKTSTTAGMVVIVAYLKVCSHYGFIRQPPVPDDTKRTQLS